MQRREIPVGEIRVVVGSPALWDPLRCHLTTTAIRRWIVRPPDWLLRLVRGLLRSADGPEGPFVAPSMVSDAGPSSLEGYWRTCTRSDDEESLVSLKSNLSVISGWSRGKKR